MEFQTDRYNIFDVTKKEKNQNNGYPHALLSSSLQNSDNNLHSKL